MSFPITLVAPLSALYAAPTSTAKATVSQGVEDELGGRWRYCKAGAAITNPLLGAGAFATFTNVTPAITAVGVWSMAYTGSDDATCTKDQYAGGTIIIGAAASDRRFYHIRGNDASTDTTGTLHFWHPVRFAMDGTEWATISPSPYRDVRPMASDGYRSVVCFPLQPVTSDYYFWGKTRGVCYGTVANNTPGAAADDRALAFNRDGALLMVDESWGLASPTSMQYAGYLMEKTASSNGDQSFMLQLE